MRKFRPGDGYLSLEPTAETNEFAAQISAQLFLGDVTVYQLNLNGVALRGKTTRVAPGLEAGAAVHVRFPEEKIKVFPK